MALGWQKLNNSYLVDFNKWFYLRYDLETRHMGRKKVILEISILKSIFLYNLPSLILKTSLFEIFKNVRVELIFEGMWMKYVADVIFKDW